MSGGYSGGRSGVGFPDSRRARRFGCAFGKRQTEPEEMPPLNLTVPDNKDVADIQRLRVLLSSLPSRRPILWRAAIVRRSSAASAARQLERVDELGIRWGTYVRSRRSVFRGEFDRGAFRKKPAVQEARAKDHQ